MTSQFICTRCGYTGEMSQAKKGSGVLEIVLWFCYLIPGLLYSIWRRSARPMCCPVCKSLDIVPTHTPAGKKLLEEQKKS